MYPGFRYPHWAGLRGCTNPYGVAAPCVFSKQSLPPCHCDLRKLQSNHRRHPFYQRYGANLPNSLGRNVPPRLRLLTQGTCVGSRYGPLPPFSRAPGVGRLTPSRLHPLLSITDLRGLQRLDTLAKVPGLSRGVGCLNGSGQRCGNINPLPFSPASSYERG